MVSKYSSHKECAMCTSYFRKWCHQRGISLVAGLTEEKFLHDTTRQHMNVLSLQRLEFPNSGSCSSVFVVRT